MDVRRDGWAHAKPDSSAAGPDDSVTDVGDPALVRAPAVEIEHGTILAGRYQVEAIIGRGGSGIVLRAFDRVARTAVAIKLLKADLAQDPRWVERFSRELRLGRQIQHSNVCRIFDIGEAEGHWFLTMDLASGGTLRDCLAAQSAPRPLAERLRDARAAIAGLAAIHTAGIVHRDVKPDNLLRMEDGRLVLSDFGLATNPSDAPAVSVLVGTPTYMAPEVVVGEPATAASDVWSMGVVLHEVLFLCRPQWGRGRSGRALRPPLSDATSRLERAMATVCAACLKDDQFARPADARALLRMFDEAQAHPLRSGIRQGRALWGASAAALAVFGLLAASRGNWATPAAATSTAVTVPSPRHNPKRVEATGTPTDWTPQSRLLASLREEVHCAAWTAGGKTLRLVVGAPRHVVDVNVATGVMTDGQLPALTYATGCPEISTHGEILFERFAKDGRREIMLATNADNTTQARALTAGTAPQWLPNGTEFVFNLDDAHAAIFSIPVMTTNLVSDDLPGAYFLVEKAVSGDGGTLALRYMDDSLKKHVVIHDLPSLVTRSSVTLPAESSRFALSHSGRRVTIALDESDGSKFATLDTDTLTLRRAGFVPGRLLRSPLDSEQELAFTATIEHGDVWTIRDGVRQEQLTKDGVNRNPDRARSGDVLAEHVDEAGRTNIRMYPRQGAPVTLSHGRLDLTPHFLPDGRGWLYVDGVERSIRRCGDAGCETLHRAREFPFFPVAAPSGRWIAYVTKINRPRLIVLDTEEKEVRDLGPARSDCAPRWSGSDTLWAIQGSERTPRWVEFDVRSGRATGASVHAGTAAAGYDSYGCPYLTDPPRVVNRAEVAVWSWEEADVRLLNRR